MVCTTIEQSKKLLDIGIDAETADMYYPNRSDIEINYPLPMEIKHGNPLLSQEIPAWSLNALINLFDFNEDNITAFCLMRGGYHPVYFRYWFASWDGGDDGIYKAEKGETPIDAVFNLILKIYKPKNI